MTIKIIAICISIQTNLIYERNNLYQYVNKVNTDDFNIDFDCLPSLYFVEKKTTHFVLERAGLPLITLVHLIVV